MWNAAIADLKHALAWAPGWVPGVVVLVSLLAAALLLHRMVGRAMIRLAQGRSPFLQSLLARGQGPTLLLLMVVAVSASLPQSYLPWTAASLVLHGLLIAFVVTLGWGGLIATGLMFEIYVRRYRTDVDDNLLARKHVTQARILRRALQTLIVCVTAATALMTIESVRQFGLSLFASAGAAGLVVGLAARPLLSNLIAGLQIAITQPIREEDAVFVEGEYGWIEGIGSTYVVIRLWDLRRLIVPLTYFIEKPFQNWTHQRAEMIGSVFLRVDYAVPVEQVRAKLAEIARASPLWDGAVVNLQVTDATEHGLELRALVSARNAAVAWDLRCEVREKLIGWLQADYPETLPRQRTVLMGRRAA